MNTTTKILIYIILQLFHNFKLKYPIVFIYKQHFTHCKLLFLHLSFIKQPPRLDYISYKNWVYFQCFKMGKGDWNNGCLDAQVSPLPSHSEESLLYPFFPHLTWCMNVHPPTLRQQIDYFLVKFFSLLTKESQIARAESPQIFSR